MFKVKTIQARRSPDGFFLYIGKKYENGVVAWTVDFLLYFFTFC
jgi:hypothetical protein